MLIITRRVGEKLFIGDDIEVVILDATSSQVKVGIVAPKEVEVFREEVYRKIKEERQHTPQPGTMTGSLP